MVLHRKKGNKKMNTATIINLPDLIRGGRNPYRGEIGAYIDAQDEERLISYLEGHHGIETTGEESMNELLALIPEGLEVDALSHMFDDPNASIEK